MSDTVTDRHRERAHRAHAKHRFAKARLDEARRVSVRSDGMVRPRYAQEAAARSEEVEALRRFAEQCDADLKHAEADADRRAEVRKAMGDTDAELAKTEAALEQARAEVQRLESQRDDALQHRQHLEHQASRTLAELGHEQEAA